MTFSQQITFLYTPDLASSAYFYEQILGFSLWLDQGLCRIYQVTASSYLGICQRDDLPQTQTLIFCLVTDEVDAWYQKLTERGVRFEKTPQVNPSYNIYHCFFRDPNGYLFEIQRFLDLP